MVEECCYAVTWTLEWRPLAWLTTRRYTSLSFSSLVPRGSSALITPVLLSPPSPALNARLYSRHKGFVRAGSVVAVICTRLSCGLLPSVRLFACVCSPPPSYSRWQIYCFMTSWNWTLVLLKLMSRNKINSFSRISCGFCAYNTDNSWVVNDILKHSEALMEWARNPRENSNVTLNLYRRQPVSCLFLDTTILVV